MNIEQIPIPTMGTGRWYAAALPNSSQQLKSWALVRGWVEAYDQQGRYMPSFLIAEAEVYKKRPEATKEEYEATYRELAEEEAKGIMEIEKLLASC